jgi:S-adenosylmethionine/arginine decarboxylase-like enzyme
MKYPPISEEILNDWFIRLVQKVRMVVVGGPTSVYVNEPGNEGVTGTVTLATSHSSIHVWDHEDPAKFQFDIYSCSCFSAEEVLAHLDEFGLIEYEWIYIDRNEGLNLVSRGEKKLF